MTRFLRHLRTARHRRRGAVLPLVAALAVVVIGMLAFSVDLGYVSLVRGQLQSAADSASLAAASQLLDRDLLHGDDIQSLTEADAQANRFASANKGGGVSLALGSGDVVYGYIADPEDPNSPLLTDRRPYNSAQVTAQRTGGRNGELGLFFAPIFNRDAMDLDAKATATYEGNVGGFRFNDNYENQTCKLLPFTIKKSAWDAAFNGPLDNWKRDPVTGAVTREPDGIFEVKLFPTRTTSGNFGTVDIGSSGNSTADIVRQILHGPSKADLDLMGGACELGEDGKLILQGDTGVSAGFKDELLAIRGKPRIIPLYTEDPTGNGNNTQYVITHFVGCCVVEVKLTGGDKYVLIQPEFCCDTTAFGGGPESDRSFALQPLRLTR